MSTSEVDSRKQFQLPAHKPKTKPPLKTKTKTNYLTHLFDIVITISSRSTAALSSNRDVSFFATTEFGAIRSISSSLASLGILGPLLSESLHLIMKLRGKILVLLCKLPDSILRNPIIPLSITWLETFSVIQHKAICFKL